MKAFLNELKRINTRSKGRRWLYVSYDQLSDEIGPLSRESPRDLGIVLIESSWKPRRRPYHKQKLALVVANLRHFALEQAARGVAVKYVFSRESFGSALRPLAGELGAMRVMEPAERELRVDLEQAKREGILETIPNEGWLTDLDQFKESLRGRSWRMDSFYRAVRKDSGVLMKKDAPLGGKFSFDAANRLPWKGEPEAPTPPRFKPDPITMEVRDLILTKYARHPGKLDPAMLPATRRDAERLWTWAENRCMRFFGPYEDAMSVRERGLFHTRTSGMLNLGRLPAGRVLDDVLGLDIPIQSKEGFARQVLGWREFVRHVHTATDGFRNYGGRKSPKARAPGDGGWSHRTRTPWRPTEGRGLDGGACPNFLGSNGSLPPAYWGLESGLACLDTVVASVWDEAYSHHITRLMILSSLATMLDVSPRELTDWFWVAYQDAFDWVVEPNVLGMGTFATGNLMTTKPYVSGAAYINKMSDYCAECRFHPARDCPITHLYWAFLARKEKRIRRIPRFGQVLAGLARRSESKKKEDARVFRRLRSILAGGEKAAPRTLYR